MSALSPQLRAADPFTDVVVTANAGSGKTSTLVSRVARLLLHGARPEEVLCVTYTKAAAAEMQRRLYDRLGGWAVADDAELTGALERLGEAAGDLPRARTLFARALETPGGLRIQTIHAFCEQLLRRFPLEAGVSPGFTVLDDAAQRELAASARERLAEAALADPEGRLGRAYAHLAAELDLRTFEAALGAFEGVRDRLERYRALAAEAGRALEDDVWARAGFDSAPVDADAVEDAASLGCDWARWRAAAAALSQVGGAVNERMAARLSKLADCAGSSPAGFAQCWEAFTTDKGEALAARSLGTGRVDGETLAWLGREQARLGEACDTAARARQAHGTVAALTLAVAYVELYEGAKSDEGALDFADLVARTRALLLERSDAAWVLYKLDGGISHLLLDEAQDTAPEQWEILRALTAEFAAGEGLPRRGDDLRARALPRGAFVVGDPKQSIYSFQGADPQRFLGEAQAMEARVRATGRAFASVDLKESWRSTPEVLRLVDAVFADPSARLLDGPLGEDVVAHEVGAPRRDHAGAVDLWPWVQDAPGEERSAWDAPLDETPPESAVKRLARRIAERVKAMIAAGEAVFDKDVGSRGDWRPMHAGDVLVLVRKRGALFEEILRALKAAKVPVAGADRLRLSDHALFADVRSLLRFSLYPWDDLTVAELLRSPFCDVDEDSLYALAQPRVEGARLWPELNARAGERREWAEARAFLAWARSEAQAGRTPFDWLGRVLSRLDARGLTVRQRMLTRLGPEAEDACEALLAEALAAEGRGVRDLERFCAELERAEVEVKREMEGAGREARVMTVHGAKGLEAPMVILPDTLGRPPDPRPPLLLDADGALLFAPKGAADTPRSRAAVDELKRRGAQEGLRLLYVALTRARDRLIVAGRLPRNCKSPPEDSWYARVGAGLVALGAEVRTVVEPDGTAVRRFGPDPQPALALTSPPTAPAEDPAWLTSLAPAEPGAASLASPSRQAERQRGPAPSPLAAAGGLGRFRRGELIHRLLQLLPDLPEGTRAGAAADMLARERDLSPEQRREMADAALGVLTDARFAPVWGEGGRAEMAIAGGSPELPPGLFVSGRVDRLVVTPERVLVVDFKTNRPSPERIEGADPAYLMQMALYVAVLREVFPGRRVEAALVWTDGPRLMAVPDNVIAQELARARRSA